MKRTSFTLEFIFRGSPAIVYKFLTDAGCLIRWFCDAVDIQDDVYTYSWEGSEEVAELIDDIEEERLRFRWEDAESDDEYLEFRLSRSPITGDTILELTDYCDDDEVEDQKALWETQMKSLRMVMGG